MMAPGEGMKFTVHTQCPEDQSPSSAFTRPIWTLPETLSFGKEKVKLL